MSQKLNFIIFMNATGITCGAIVGAIGAHLDWRWEQTALLSLSLTASIITLVNIFKP